MKSQLFLFFNKLAEHPGLPLGTVLSMMFIFAAIGRIMDEGQLPMGSSLLLWTSLACIWVSILGTAWMDRNREDS